jgi:hypothetical protein
MSGDIPHLTLYALMACTGTALLYFHPNEKQADRLLKTDHLVLKDTLTFNRNVTVTRTLSCVRWEAHVTKVFPGSDLDKIPWRCLTKRLRRYVDFSSTRMISHCHYARSSVCFEGQSDRPTSVTYKRVTVERMTRIQRSGLGASWKLVQKRTERIYFWR